MGRTAWVWYNKEGDWCRGRVTQHNGDGTHVVDFSDGETEDVAFDGDDTLMLQHAKPTKPPPSVHEKKKKKNF